MSSAGDPIGASGRIAQPDFNCTEASSDREKAWCLLWQIQQPSTGAGLSTSPGTSGVGRGLSPGQLGFHTLPEFLATWETLDKVPTAAALTTYLTAWAAKTGKQIPWKTLASYGTQGKGANRVYSHAKETYYWGLPLGLGENYKDFVTFVGSQGEAGQVAATLPSAVQGHEVLLAMAASKTAPGTAAGKAAVVDQYNVLQSRRTQSQQKSKDALADLTRCIGNSVSDSESRTQVFRCLAGFRDAEAALRRDELATVFAGLQIQGTYDSFRRTKTNLLHFATVDLGIDASEAQGMVDETLRRFGNDYTGAVFDLLAKSGHIPAMQSA